MHEHVWHAYESDTTRPEDSLDLLQRGERVRDVLEKIPHRHSRKGSSGKVPGDQIVTLDRQSQLLDGVRDAYVGDVQAVWTPSGIPGLVKKRSEATAYIQDRPTTGASTTEFSEAGPVDTTLIASKAPVTGRSSIAVEFNVLVDSNFGLGINVDKGTCMTANDWKGGVDKYNGGVVASTEIAQNRPRRCGHRSRGSSSQVCPLRQR
ncbi:MAG: hypothetical protein M3256_03755 [Actinomycetota bacterium]|nr:hypothetical protein [Actinomycetota bacterium]